MLSGLTSSCCYCFCCYTGWSLTSAKCLILFINLGKSLRASYQFMSVGVSINDGPFVSKVFWSSDNTALDKLMAFWSGAFSIISLISCFFLALYRLHFSFLLSTAIFLLNLLFLFCGAVVHCIWSCCFLRLCRDFILCSRITTFWATSFLISL